MRVLCIGDSLPLPREGCDYTDTWFARLKKAYPSVEFINDFKGGMTTMELLHSWNYMRHTNPDVVIIQEGICDCAPRYVNDNSLFWKVVITVVEKLRIANLFWKIIKTRKRRATCTYTSKSAFYNNYDQLLRKIYEIGVKFIIIIKIGHGASSIVLKSESFNKNVDLYNVIFDKLKIKYKDKLILADPLKQVDDSLFVDGYHCNRAGMNLVFLELTTILEPIV